MQAAAKCCYCTFTVFCHGRL